MDQDQFDSAINGVNILMNIGTRLAYRQALSGLRKIKKSKLTKEQKEIVEDLEKKCSAYCGSDNTPTLEVLKDAAGEYE